MEQLRCKKTCENINELLSELEAELGKKKTEAVRSDYTPALPLPKGRLQIVCADCLKYMGDKDGDGMTGISHSLCPKCAKKAYEMIEDEIPLTNIPIGDGQTQVYIDNGKSYKSSYLNQLLA